MGVVLGPHKGKKARTSGPGLSTFRLPFAASLKQDVAQKPLVNSGAAASTDIGDYLAEVPYRFEMEAGEERLLPGGSYRYEDHHEPKRRDN